MLSADEKILEEKLVRPKHKANCFFRILFCVVYCSSVLHTSAQCPNGSPLGTELVFNGNFNLGNTGFTSGYQYTANNTVEGQYYVGDSAQAYQWNGGVTIRGAHINAATDFLMVNGDPIAGVDAWCQTISVTPNTTYVFSFWLTSVSGCCYAVLQFYFNGVALDTTVTAPLDTGWIPFSTTWNSGSNTSVSICIQDQNISRGGNDFGITGISLKPCNCNLNADAGAIIASPAMVCSGDSSQLSDTGTSGNIQWQSSADSVSFTNIPGATSPTYTAHGIAQKTFYRVFATGSCGADTSLVRTVSVSPLPVTGIISAFPDSICSGNISVLTVAGSSGNIQWQSSADGISFANIPGATSAEYFAFNLSQSIYYRVMINEACGTDSSTAILVNVFPVPSTGIITVNPNPICEGQSSELSLSEVTASVQWQISDSLGNFSDIPFADSLFYNTPSLSRTSDFRVVVDKDVCSDTSTIFTVIVNPSPQPPILSVDDSLICSADSALITSSGGYSSYTWNTGDTHPYTYVNASGGYWVTVTGTDGCSVSSGHVNVYVYPVSSVSIVVEGDTLSSFNATAYQWYVNDTIIPAATSPVYIASATGDYTVEITDTNGCKTTSNGIYVTATGTVDLNENNSNDIEIYPNPTKGNVFISTNNSNLQVKIFNIIGQEVTNVSTRKLSSAGMLINIQNLPVGTYEFQLIDNQKYSTVLIVKE